MAMMSPLAQALPQTDVYTNLQGLQSIARDGDQEEGLKKVAQQFESMFINLMLKNMRQANAVFEEDSLFNSKESDFYRDMHDHQLSLTLAHGKGFGIAETLYRQMSQNYAGSADKQGQMTVPQVEGKVSTANRSEFAATPESFIEKIMPYVKKAASKLGVEADILAAQAALETGSGKKMLANDNGKVSNNLFNIKKDAGWQGESLSVNTLEHKNGVFQKEKSEFKSYASIADSVSDYVQFLTNGTRYKKALESSGNSLDFVKQLQNAGYATDPNYAEKIYSVYSRIKALTGVDK